MARRGFSTPRPRMVKISEDHRVTVLNLGFALISKYYSEISLNSLSLLYPLLYGVNSKNFSRQTTKMIDHGSGLVERIQIKLECKYFVHG